jgi:hypothetical protein
MAIFSSRGKYSWLFVIWVIIGIVVAWGHSYITLHLV